MEMAVVGPDTRCQDEPNSAASDHCRVQAVLWWQASNGGKGHALRQHNDSACQTGKEVGLEGVFADQLKPG